VTTSLRRLALAAALWLPAAAGANAGPPEVAQALPEARLVGDSRLRFLIFQVYDIRLWSPASGADIARRWDQVPLALEIAYALALDGGRIAERSLEEMRRQGPIPAERERRWLAHLKRLIPDVEPGDRVTGVQQPGVGLRIYLNGVLRGEVLDPDFTRTFFGIWLAPQTSEPDLRLRLVGS
jgi:hypothetical protein